MRTQGPSSLCFVAGGPAAQVGCFSWLLEDGKGASRGSLGSSYTHPCHTAPTRLRLCAPVTALVTLSCHHLFLGRL